MSASLVEAAVLIFVPIGGGRSRSRSSPEADCAKAIGILFGAVHFTHKSESVLYGLGLNHISSVAPIGMRSSPEAEWTKVVPPPLVEYFLLVAVYFPTTHVKWLIWS